MTRHHWACSIRAYENWKRCVRGESDLSFPIHRTVCKIVCSNYFVNHVHSPSSSPSFCPSCPQPFALTLTLASVTSVSPSHPHPQNAKLNYCSSYINAQSSQVFGVPHWLRIEVDTPKSLKITRVLWGI
jgi:hypothetical protein